MDSRLARNLPAAVLFAATLVAWQLAVTVFQVREYLLPSPLAVLRATRRRRGAVGSGTCGSPPSRSWARSCWPRVVGVALGVAIAWSSLLASALVPFLVFVNTLPKVAVAPLFLLWLGYGIVPNMLIGALIGFFPVVINTAVGLTQVDEELLDLGRVFNAPKWKVFAKIRIPNAYPYILSALKVTATAAVVGAIVGEFVASQNGLGYVIIDHPGQHEHAGRLRRARLDLDHRPRGVRRRRRRRPLDRAVGGHLSMTTRRLSMTRMPWIRRPRRRRPRGRRRHARPPPRRRRRSPSRSTGSRSATTPPTGWRSTRATTRPRGSTSSSRTPRARATRSPRSTPGRADIGLADSAVVIAAVARGAKVKVVGMVFDKTPLNIWTRKDTAIDKPKDLEGKTVGAPPGDGQRQVFPAFAKLHGIDESKVTWVNIEPAAKVRGAGREARRRRGRLHHRPALLREGDGQGQPGA